MTEYQTRTSLRIRFKALPKAGEFEEFDLHWYRPGLEYDVPLRLASLLMIAGYAELVTSVRLRETAADSSRKRTRRKR
jgi:hypothetical protein